VLMCELRKTPGSVEIFRVTRPQGGRVHDEKTLVGKTRMELTET
jgi:hypothetical protein